MSDSSDAATGRPEGEEPVGAEIGMTDEPNTFEPEEDAEEDPTPDSPEDAEDAEGSEGPGA
ncbi:hypothetical protein [Nocardioides sp. zg-1228]|uniref:hypothetical protein n=1 Tax=Nocardioides sp. zg-1228 TaxID=2763008 RepID=UPI00164331C2|nr:hypothetical protein [Nocardioides sp. zg-1228]MBC2934828.1 hypothetical protein [Nocardioides sp. zg-1228]QSF58381.1 hypothetical protein JX575_04025 [Nocardioides sp. zg-1228]